MRRRLQLRLPALLIAYLTVFPPAYAFAWNIPGHMLSGSIAYQILRTESAATIAVVRSTLEKHPWYESQWKAQFDALPESQRNEIFFMLAARWSDDIRTRDKAQHRGPWHYINFPFKPVGQPASVQTKPPQAVNILIALAENERITKSEADLSRKAIALTWLFHLVGDIHQPLHSAQIFTTDYPDGDRGGNQICVQPTETRVPMDLHRFWDGVITTNSNTSRLMNEATTLRNRAEFSRGQLTELTNTDYESWAKESFQIAIQFAYQNGAALGSPKGDRRECRELTEAKVLPPGYARIAGRISDRRIMLAGFRLADLLKRL